MELNEQIKKYRTEMNLSQEELAEKIYVTRQSVSNWENGKTYPDIHSLLLLSSLFSISLDQLVKGDIEIMKEEIKKEEIAKMNRYGRIYAIMLVATVVSATPLFMWLERWAFLPWGIIFSIMIYFSLKVDKIKKYRTEMDLSQEELAEKIYVTRQSISNWENGKTYPDIHSLLLLSSLFGISLDQLVKGDIEIMKEEIKKEEIAKMNRYGKIYTLMLIATAVSAVPLFMWLGVWAFIPWGIIWAISLCFAFKLEKVKKTNDVQTYKEIVAFSEGKRLDDIQKQREIGKRPYQKILLVIGSALITFVVCVVIGFLMHIFLN